MATLAPQAPAGGVELAGRRTAAARHYLLPDGSFVAHIGSGPWHYQPNPGDAWADIDLSLHSDGAGGLVADRNAVVVGLSGATLTVRGRGGGPGLSWTFPQAPVQQGADSFRVAVGPVTFTYRLTLAGVKAAAVIAAPLGARQLTFNYARIAGPATAVVNLDGSVTLGAVTLPKPAARGADAVDYQVGSWTLAAGNRVTLVYDDGGLPAEAFPLTLDPTTNFTVAASGDDGESRLTDAASTTWPPTTAGSDTTAVQSGAFRDNNKGNLKLANFLVRFDTSSLAGTTITAASLNLFVVLTSNFDTRSFLAEYYSTSNWPIDNADCTNTTSATAHAGTAISSLTVTANNAFALLSPDANINKAGYTGFRTHISGGAPTLGVATVALNNVQVNTQDNGSNKPFLAVTYALNRSTSSSITHTTTIARRFVGTRQATSSVSASATVTRLLSHPRSVASVVANTATLARRFVGSRGLTSSVAHAATLLRTGTFVTYRAVSSTIAHTATLARRFAGTRGITSSIFHLANLVRSIILGWIVVPPVRFTLELPPSLDVDDPYRFTLDQAPTFAVDRVSTIDADDEPSGGVP